MKFKFETVEEPNRLTVTNNLRDKRFEDPEVQAQLEGYKERKKGEFSQENETLANAQLTLHMAEIYFEAGYKGIALKELATLEPLDLGPEFTEEVKDLQKAIIEDR